MQKQCVVHAPAPAHLPRWRRSPVPVYGEVFKNWDAVGDDEVIDLAAAINGGKAIACNDMFFSAMGNLIMPGRGVNMGDGGKPNGTARPITATG